MRFGVVVVAVLVVLAGCTRPNPGVSCENELECTRIGLAGDDIRTCLGEAVCVANACVSEGCDGDEDCDARAPFCVSGSCVNGCDGNEDCLDPALPICDLQSHECVVDCVARGGRIAFESSRAAGDVMIMFADGFAPEPILPGAPIDTRPIWSPNGGQLAFLRAGDVFVSDVRMPMAINVSNNIEEDDHVAWSPDGTRVAFDSSAGANRHARTALLDGSDVTMLVGSLVNDSPTWAPDGKLAFRSGMAITGMTEIWIANSDGSSPTEITGALTGDEKRNLRWSPDGTKLVFLTAQRLTVITPGGVPLLEVAGEFEDVVWSPDSSKLAVVEGEAGNPNIATADVDGTITRLTTATGVDEHPRWSPDGTAIVFESDRDGNREIYRMDANGSNQVNITNHPEDDRFPEWGVCPSE